MERVWIEKADWRRSEARQILLNAHKPGGDLVDNHDAPEVVWERYRDKDHFNTMLFHQFQAKLKYYRRASAKKKGWIKWYPSAPREVLLQDLENGGYLHCNNEEAEELWEKHYKQLPQFQEVPFAQFKENLKSHRKASMKEKMRSKLELEALHHDRNKGESIVLDELSYTKKNLARTGSLL